jgi:tetratricopeptide (TPR) repeat protein
MFDRQKVYASGGMFSSLETENYFIDYIPGERNHLVITFENADQPKNPRLDGLREPWGADFLCRRGYSVLGIKPKRVEWYRGPDLHAFFRSHSFQVFISSFKQVFLYGSSMGGYAALVFSATCPNAVVIAFNPQSTLHPDLAGWDPRYPEGSSQDWTGDFADAKDFAAAAKAVYIAYDPLFEIDNRHVVRLPQTNIIPLKMPLVGHVMMSWMSEAGILVKFVEEALAGSLSAQRCRQLARGRRSAPRYYYVMGMRARSASVALACARKLLGFTLKPHQQQDFKTLVLTRKLWDCLKGPDAEKALAAFDEATLYIILKAASDQGRADRALAICERVINTREPGARILFLAAECGHRLARLVEAKAWASRAVAQDPTTGNAHRILARILFDSGETAAAVAAGAAGAAVDPGSWLGWLDLAKYHEALKQWQAALSCANRALSINPTEQRIIGRVAALSTHAAKYDLQHS